MNSRLRIDEAKVKRRMAALGLGNYTEVAERSDGALGTRTIYRIVDSHTWTSGTLHALADALECAPFDLLSVDLVPEGETLALAA